MKSKYRDMVDIYYSTLKVAIEVEVVAEAGVDIMMVVSRTGGVVTRTTVVIDRSMVVITTATGGGADTEEVGAEGVRIFRVRMMGTGDRDRIVESSSGKPHQVNRRKNEPRCEKTGLRGFRPGPTQTGLHNHRR